MSGDGLFLWYFHVGPDEPDIWAGGEATREIAIAAARAEGGDAEGFHIVEADSAVPRFAVFDADTMIEHWEECNDDCFPGGDPEPITATVEQKADLERALGEAFQAWLDRNEIVSVVTGFGTMRNQEYFPPDDAGQTS